MSTEKQRQAKREKRNAKNKKQKEKERKNKEAKARKKKLGGVGEIGLSELMGKSLKLVGHGVEPHPLKHGWFLHFWFYQYDGDKFVFANSELESVTPTQEVELGCVVPGEAVAPWATRQVAGATFAQFRAVIAEAFANEKFICRWMDDK